MVTNRLVHKHIKKRLHSIIKGQEDEWAGSGSFGYFIKANLGETMSFSDAKNLLKKATEPLDMYTLSLFNVVYGNNSKSTFIMDDKYAGKHSPGNILFCVKNLDEDAETSALFMNYLPGIFQLGHRRAVDFLTSLYGVIFGDDTENLDNYI
jgi:hypothetical protein